MPKNRPRCHCGAPMKRNGTTTKGTTRWRCTSCGASSIKQRRDITNAAAFTAFINHLTTSTTLATLADHMGCSPRTLQRRFATFWLIDVPTTTDPGRVYDQIFLDATYTASGCLIIAASIDHVITWRWWTQETTFDYQRLIENIPAPFIAVIDGGRGAFSAIKHCWPDTAIQRCLVHAQRVIRRYTTSRPRTDAGRAIYRLALNLTRITTCDHTATWGAQLQEFFTIYHRWLNEKTNIKDQTTGRWKQVYTHANVRKAYNSLNHLWRNDHLFVYLNPPEGIIDAHRLKSTTNSLEGGINAQLKLLARNHRGRGGEHQRRMLDWWLYLQTQLPNDPVSIARQQRWGQDALAKVTALTKENENQANRETQTTSPLRQCYPRCV